MPPTATILTKEKRCRGGWVLLERGPNTLPSCRPSCASSTSPATPTSTTTTPDRERPCKPSRFTEPLASPPNPPDPPNPSSETDSSGSGASSSSYPPSPAEIDDDYILVDFPRELALANRPCRGASGATHLGLVARLLVEAKRRA